MLSLDNTEKDLIGFLSGLSLVSLCSEAGPLLDPADAQLAEAKERLLPRLELAVRLAHSATLAAIPSSELQECISGIDTSSGTYYSHHYLSMLFSLYVDSKRELLFRFADSAGLQDDLGRVAVTLARKLVVTVMSLRARSIDNRRALDSPVGLMRQMSELLSCFEILRSDDAAGIGRIPWVVQEAARTWIRSVASAELRGEPISDGMIQVRAEIQASLAPKMGGELS